MKRLAVGEWAVMGLLLFGLGGCAENAREESATELHVDGQSQSDTSFVQPDQASDVEPADMDPADVDPADMDPADVKPPPDMRRDATGLDLLYCELTDDDLITAALRAGACLEEVSVAGVLNEASRGFVFGELHTWEYSPATYGNCDFLVCLAEARNCQQAARCDADRWKEPCGPGEWTRCDGDFLEACTWRRAAEEYRWLEVQDCTRLADGDGYCTTDAEGKATCQGTNRVSAEEEPCSLFDQSCDGDEMILCTEPDLNDWLYTVVPIDCGELIEGGTCVMTPLGGEFPGPACAVENMECTNSFAEGFTCDPQSGKMTLCFYGEVREIQCQEYGYSTCEERGFFGTRCVP